FHQAVVHGANGQGGVGRQLARGDVAVAEDQQHLAGLHGGFGLVGEAAHRSLEAHGLVVVQVDDMAFEAGTIQLHEGPPLGREITGLLRMARLACSGVSSNTLRSAPRQVSSDMTMASRSGSIGGLVTWANCWRK